MPRLRRAPRRLVERRQAEVRRRAPVPAPRGWAAAVSGSFSALLFAIPGLAAILAPVPLLIGYRRRGWRAGFAATGIGLATTLFIGLSGSMLAGADAALALSASGQTVVYAVAVALPAGLLGWSTARVPTGAQALQLAAVAYLGALAVMLVGAGTLGGDGVVGMMSGWVDSSLDTVTALYREQALERAAAVEALAHLELGRETYREWGTRLFPAAAAAAVVLSLWLNLVYSRWFTGANGSGDDLSQWKLPMGVMYVFMAAAAGVVVQVESLGSLLPRMEWLLSLAASGLLFCLMLYWLQGVAVANFYFLRLRLSPLSRMLGVALQAVLMLNPGTTWLFGCVGLIDAWFDVRRFGADDGQAQVPKGT